MTEGRIHLLLVEDNPGDARLVREMLRDAPEIETDVVDRLAPALDRLSAGGIDLVLLDLGLPDSTGLDTVRSVTGAAPSVPVVVLTGHDDEATGTAAVRSGAQDYLMKGQVRADLLCRTLRFALERQRAEAEREKLQAQLLQAQKMESVGRLAGGVAHDFNNMLAVIVGRAELALMRIKTSDPLRADLEEIQKAARRSVKLTRQLLAFARKQTVAPKVLDLNDTVSGMLNMLRRLIGEDIDLAWMPGHDLWKVRIDPSQIDQILANLLVNARDAIAGVGKVTIETQNVTFAEAFGADRPGFVLGAHVMLAVSDDGCGMDKKTLTHLFEPFFTTKDVGQGTGLGLATIYGIVKQNDGFINVYSDPGKGTTFTIYFPRYAGKAATEQAEAPAEPPKGRGETMLLVEDEITILKMGKLILEQLGYTVVTAGSPGEAIRQVESHPGEIHMLITDVVMPNMNGWELAERVRAIRPGMKCLFMSGHTANVIAHRGVLYEGVQFIEKPFSLQGLASKVRETLEQK
jgi:two-component system cell cycle sensor histidine kinase/response regulator CckA